MKRRLFRWLYRRVSAWRLRALLALVYGLHELGGWAGVAEFVRESWKEARRHGRRNKARPQKTVS
jgi:hypothetical protein